MSIRSKVILPYLLLTIIVAVTGVYVVTRLVASTLSERLTNQLLEAGRVVSDSFVRQELKHVESARIIAFTTGLGEAVLNRDRAAALVLVQPVASGLGAENLILVAPDGEEFLQLIKDKDGKLSVVDQNTQAGRSPIVAPLLAGRDTQSPPLRALGLNLVDDRYYYFTSIPISANDQFAGVVVIGTSLDTILPFLKNTSLADVILYGQDGQAIATTLGAGTGDSTALAGFSLTPAQYKAVLTATKVVSGQNFTFDGRWYSLARGPLQIGNDRLGAFAVVLPLNFVIQSGTTNRNTYVVMFTSAMLAVVLLGYGIARLIINPLSSLVKTSQAIATGDLEQRTGIQSGDEIGVLAQTFDEMTERLRQRTLELESTNRMLQKMDQTKGTFIQVSAHELRTPLTLVTGYTQMLEQKAKSDPELGPLAKGILEGSNRMTEIVNSMLDVSRIDSNALSVAPTRLQISSPILKAQKAFKGAFDERKLTFTTTGLDSLPLVYADPDLLYKVFYQVLMNSVKFTPDGGRITVTGRLVDESASRPQVQIAVADTGIGIDPQYHEMVFEKFYQTGEVLLHSSGKTKFKGGGPGLGLAIARGIVEAHKGRIWVESPGYNETACPGSTFFIRLPVDGPSQ